MYSSHQWENTSIWFQIRKKLLLILELNSQSNYTPPLRAPEALCWLVGIVYGSVRATTLVSHLQSQDCVQTPEFYGQLEDCEEQLAEWDKKRMGLESPTAPLNPFDS